MQRLTLALLGLLLFTGCGEQPTYELHIGDKVIVLPLHDDPELVRQDVVAHIRPLWTSLRQGDSEAFWLHSETVAVGDERIQVGGKTVDVTLESRSAFSTGKHRFYKRRDGRSGYEAEGADGWAIMVDQPSPNWDAPASAASSIASNLIDILEADAEAKAMIAEREQQ